MASLKDGPEGQGQRENPSRGQNLKQCTWLYIMLGGKTAGVQIYGRAVTDGLTEWSGICKDMVRKLVTRRSGEEVRPLQMGTRYEDICVQCDAHQRVTSAESLSNQAGKVTHSLEPASLFLLLSLPNGLMNKVASAAGIKVSLGLSNMDFYSLDLSTATAECPLCQTVSPCYGITSCGSSPISLWHMDLFSNKSGYYSQHAIYYIPRTCSSSNLHPSPTPGPW